MQSGDATILLRAAHAPAAAFPARRTADLRRFRMARRPHSAPGARGERLRRLLDEEPRIDAPDPAKSAAPDLGSRAACPKSEPKEEPSSSESGEGGAVGSLAAAIIRRAVLLCRASLYPGLHTIIAPPPAPAPPECAWCARHFAARRCLWYGPAREPALAARVWRRARGRRYLCACCGAHDDAPRAADAALDDGGWYGKGYRKGRRRRR